MKKLIKSIPFFGPMVVAIKRKLFPHEDRFCGSERYWKGRYQTGGTSGDGSHGRLAEFKAEVLNAFVETHEVSSVMEFGCGDGNQLRLATYPSYLGFDISQKAIELCCNLFADDSTKSFKLANDYDGEKAELTLSLDVIYHLIEDEVFDRYMERLFDSSTKFVAIYSSNSDRQQPDQPPHVRHRCFTDWIAKNEADWKLVVHIPNRYPFSGDNRSGSHADFHIYGMQP